MSTAAAEQMFEAIDQNHDGLITREEWNSAQAAQTVANMVQHTFPTQTPIDAAAPGQVLYQSAPIYYTGAETALAGPALTYAAAPVPVIYQAAPVYITTAAAKASAMEAAPPTTAEMPQQPMVTYSAPIGQAVGGVAMPTMYTYVAAPIYTAPPVYVTQLVADNQEVEAHVVEPAAMERPMTTAAEISAGSAMQVTTYASQRVVTYAAPAAASYQTYVSGTPMVTASAPVYSVLQSPVVVNQQPSVTPAASPAMTNDPATETAVSGTVAVTTVGTKTKSKLTIKKKSKGCC